MFNGRKRQNLHFVTGNHPKECAVILVQPKQNINLYGEGEILSEMAHLRLAGPHALPNVIESPDGYGIFTNSLNVSCHWIVDKHEVDTGVEETRCSQSAV